MRQWHFCRTIEISILLPPMIRSRLLPVLADVGMIVVVAVLPHVAGLPMIVYPQVVLLLLFLYLRWKKLTFSDIGFRWRDLSWKSLFTGCIIGVAWAFIVFFLIGPLIVSLTGFPPADLSDFEFVRHNPVQLLFLLAVAWLLVIPYEEVIFRGFVLTTLRHLFNDTQSPGPGSTFQGFRFWLAGIIQSIIFAAYHWQEGPSAVLSIFIGSILTVWLYKIFNGNLWYLVFFRAAYDTVMLYLFAFGYL